MTDQPSTQEGQVVFASVSDFADFLHDLGERAYDCDIEDACYKVAAALRFVENFSPRWPNDD